MTVKTIFAVSDNDTAFNSYLRLNPAGNKLLNMLSYSRDEKGFATSGITYAYSQQVEARHHIIKCDFANLAKTIKPTVPGIAQNEGVVMFYNKHVTNTLNTARANSFELGNLPAPTPRTEEIEEGTKKSKSSKAKAALVADTVTPATDVAIYMIIDSTGTNIETVVDADNNFTGFTFDDANEELEIIKLSLDGTVNEQTFIDRDITNAVFFVVNDGSVVLNSGSVSLQLQMGRTFNS